MEWHPAIGGILTEIFIYMSEVMRKHSLFILNPECALIRVLAVVDQGVSVLGFSIGT